MTDIEMLPLPAWTGRYKVPTEPMSGEDEMLDDLLRRYARAVAEHNVNRERERAERLAEALRELLALPIAEEELRHLDKGIGTATRNAAWLRARAALRDHDQEEGK